MKLIPLKRLLSRPTSGGIATQATRRRRLRRLLESTQLDKAHVAASPARIALFVLTVVFLSVLLCIHLWPNRVSLRLGDISDREIVAPRSVRYVDTEATRQLREDAIAQVDKQYDIIQDATTQATYNVRTIFDILDQYARLSRSAPRPAPKVASPLVKHSVSPRLPTPFAGEKARETVILGDASAQIQHDSSVTIPLSAVNALLHADQASRAQARALAMKLVERTMARTITDDDDDEIPILRRALRTDPRLADLPQALREPVGIIAGDVLMPTRRFAPRETERRRQAAAASVVPQMIRLTAGTVVIRAGDRVTQQDLDEFAALGLQTARPDAATVAAIVLLVFLLVSIAAFYLRRFNTEMFNDTRRLLLLTTLTVMSVLGLKIGSSLLGIPIRGIQLGYLGMMSVASCGMIIALLLSPRAGTLIVALLSVASGLMLNNEVRFTVITLASSLVGIISVSSLRNRNDLLRTGLLLCGANAAFTALVGQIEGDLPLELLTGVVWSVVSGAFSILLFLFGIAILEKPFGITTHLRLLELSDPATSVLQEFRLRVPGTYAHSLMVGTLAHAAAEAIGADGLLVRVAAYYHDLGKMNRPEFYIENQSNAENVHDRLNPSLSAIILASHVKEGVEMATEIGLPPRVRELIQQHHGTSLMKFFYHRATGGDCGTANPDTSLEAQFRYPGPKPQSREAAILMLADTVEAASRVLDRPTPSRISDFVQHLIDEKRADGQLDDCDLTQRDLKMIHAMFVRTLSGALHARIDYPEAQRAPQPETAKFKSPGFAPARSVDPLAAPTKLRRRAHKIASLRTIRQDTSIEHGDNAADPGRTRATGLGARRGGGKNPPNGGRSA